MYKDNQKFYLYVFFDLCFFDDNTSNWEEIVEKLQEDFFYNINVDIKVICAVKGSFFLERLYI